MPSKKTLELRLSVANLFSGKCFICHKKIGTGKRFLFHHLRYLKDEKRYADFTSQTAYHEYLIPKIHEDPDRFMLLCNGCHGNLRRTETWSDGRLKRFVTAVKRGRP